MQNVANIRNNNKNSFNKTEDINKTNKVDCIEEKNASVFYDGKNQKEMSKSSSIDSANDSKTASKVEGKNVSTTTLNDDDKKAILDQLNKVQESSQNSSYAKTGKASANTSKNSSQTPLTTLYGDSEEVIYLNNTEREDESADEKLKDDFKKELNKKANKEKKVKPKTSKKSFKQRMKTLGILTVLGVFTGCGLGVWYFNNAVVPPVNYGQYNASDYQTKAEDVLGELFGISSDYENWRNSSEFLSSDVDSPSDLTPVQNFLLAEFNALNSDYFHIVGNGRVKVSAFGIPISQTVYSEKNFDGNTYTFESISEGTKDIGKCSVMEKPTSLNPNPEVMLFSSSDVYTSEGASITDNAVWGNYETYTQDAYIDLAGGLPNGIQTYIISDKTITSTNDSSVITYDEATGYYTFTIELDPITSVLNYVRQVQQTSGLGSAPTFESVKQTITIDGEWNLISISIEERYSVLYGGISAGCSGTLTSYYYLNQPELIDFPDLPIEL